MEKLKKIPHKFLFYFGFFIVLIFLSLSYWQFTSFQNDKITLNEFKNNTDLDPTHKTKKEMIFSSIIPQELNNLLKMLRNTSE